MRHNFLKKIFNPYFKIEVGKSHFKRFLIFQNAIKTFIVRYFTLHKKKVIGQLKNREKCFKICYVYGKRKPMQFFSFFIQSNFHFPLMNALVYVDIDQGIHKGKTKVAINEKRKKTTWVFISINVANFEAFFSVFKLTKNRLFLKSVNRVNLTNIIKIFFLHNSQQHFLSSLKITYTF